ncbi:MAG: universal stress protein [Aeromicrobium sp.]
MGVDSSKGSRAAVAWAATMSVQSSATLRLVSVYGSSGSVVRRRKQDALDDISNALRCLPDSPWESSVAAGEPAARLIDAARGATMLVVGRHGTEGMMHSASASVGDTCGRLADCPVVVVPHS